MSERVAKLKELTKDQPESPLRPYQMTEINEERARLTRFVEGPGYQPGDRGAARNRIRQLDKMVAEQGTKTLTGPKRDEVYKAAQEVLENDIKPQLQSRAAMRRNPAGAVGTFLKTEASKPFLDAALTWKRSMLAVDPQNEDPDYVNYEVHRREGDAHDGTSTFMADAQIPGHMAMSPQAKANWPLGEPTVDTALAQSKRAQGLAKARAAKARKAADRKFDAAQAEAAAQGDPDAHQ